MGKIIVLLTSFLITCFSSGEQLNPINVSSDPKSFLGTWEIYRYENYYEHDSNSLDLAKKSMGARIEFGSKFCRVQDDAFSISKGKYRNVSYSIKTRNYNFLNGKLNNDDYDYCSLASWGFPEAFKDKSIYFVLKTKLGEMEFEIGKNGELSLCSEDVTIFLKKIK